VARPIAYVILLRSFQWWRYRGAEAAIVSPSIKEPANIVETSGGDVNRDGYADVAIRHTSRQVVIANMAGGVNDGYIGLGNIAGFAVRAIDDVNGDGYADVIVQNEADGQTLWRDLSGEGPAWNVATDAMGMDWILRRAADVDNDGSADLIFQHATSGQTVYRAMDAGVGTGWDNVSSPLGTEWVVV
jgi:hypothetical protein